MKSKKKEVEVPVYEITLNFTNNLFQTYLFEIFEKMSITLTPQKIIQDNVELFNLIKITYKEDTFLLIFFDKNIATYVNNNFLFLLIEKYQKITKKEITFVFFEISEDAFKEKNDLIFFLNTEARIKVFDCNNSTDLIDYLQNYTDSIITKEEKSKLTFFDSKPVQTTALCELEGITDADSITWVKHLMCIPGVSENKAISIAKVYPNFISLMELYESKGFNEREKEMLLQDIEIANKAKDKVTRLGGALSAKIYKVFNSSDPNTIIN